MRLFQTASLGLLIVGIAPAAVLTLWGPALFGWVFGARWVLAGSIAAIVAPWYLAQFVASPLSRVVVVLSGQESKLIWDVLCLVSLMGVFVSARFWGLAPLPTIRVLSAVYAMLYVVYYSILVYVVASFDRSRRAAKQPC
jgi:O-antigen/teichoic acid export membrane protein